MNQNVALQNTSKPNMVKHAKTFSYVFWNQVKHIPKNWDDLVSSHDLFLSRAYFEALEQAMPERMNHHYVGFYCAEKLVGVALFQTTRIKASEAYRPKLSKTNGIFFIEKFIKTHIPKLFNLNILVGGNLMLTGEHSYYFDFNEIPKHEAINVWYKAINDFKKTQDKLNLTLLKDFFEDKNNAFKTIEKDQNYPYYVEPNMILHLKPEWNTLADYTEAMTKKYRARVRTARKKSILIEKKELSFEEIVAHRESIFSLYESVSENASFNTFLLHENYFEEMKRYMDKKFRLVAYFLEGKIVGFFTLFLEQKDVVTHFLGYCPKLNRSHQLYLNMLFDMVEIGIYEKKESVIYARTALEIKSSIGAVPYQMKGFIKYEKPLLNRTIFSLFQFLKPKDDWEQRNPFKE